MSANWKCTTETLPLSGGASSSYGANRRAVRITLFSNLECLNIT